jgi:hypothetical protein
LVEKYCIKSGKKMKKLICIYLIFVLVLTGCGNLNKPIGKQNDVKPDDTLAELGKDDEAKVSLGIYNVWREYKSQIGVTVGVLLCIVVGVWIRNMIVPLPAGGGGGAPPPPAGGDQPLPPGGDLRAQILAILTGAQTQLIQNQAEVLELLEHKVGNILKLSQTEVQARVQAILVSHSSPNVQAIFLVQPQLGTRYFSRYLFNQNGNRVSRKLTYELAKYIQHQYLVQYQLAEVLDLTLAPIILRYQVPHQDLVIHEAQNLVQLAHQARVLEGQDYQDYLAFLTQVASLNDQYTGLIEFLVPKAQNRQACLAELVQRCQALLNQ